MKNRIGKIIKRHAIAFGGLLLATTVMSGTLHAEADALQSVSVLSFSTNNVLFVGDSKAGAIHAYELGTAPMAKESKAYNLTDINQTIADALGTSTDQIAVKDLAVHPASKVAYVGVTRGHGDKAMPVIVTIDQSGAISPFDPETLKSSTYTLKNPISAELVVWNNVKARTLAITDIDYVDGELFVAGLSNADFSSTLHRISYPFNKAQKTSSIEMYHAVHSQNETRAPIRTQAIVKLGGKLHVLGAYTCTPLVTIPLDQLKDGAHVTAKTIAELGYGNTPIDVVAYQAYNMQSQKMEDFVMVTNKQRGTQVFPLASLESTVDQEGIKPGTMKNPFGKMAPQHMMVPMAGLLHIADQDQQFMTALRRDLETGNLDLVSFRKGAYFRLSDFVSEYMLPGYEYSEDSVQMKGFQDLLKKDEGYL